MKNTSENGWKGYKEVLPANAIVTPELKKAFTQKREMGVISRESHRFAKNLGADVTKHKTNNDWQSPKVIYRPSQKHFLNFNAVSYKKQEKTCISSPKKQEVKSSFSDLDKLILYKTSDEAFERFFEEWYNKFKNRKEENAKKQVYLNEILSIKCIKDAQRLDMQKAKFFSFDSMYSAKNFILSRHKNILTSFVEVYGKEPVKKVFNNFCLCTFAVRHQTESHLIQHLCNYLNKYLQKENEKAIAKQSQQPEPLKYRPSEKLRKILYKEPEPYTKDPKPICNILGDFVKNRESYLQDFNKSQPSNEVRKQSIDDYFSSEQYQRYIEKRRREFLNT